MIDRNRSLLLLVDIQLDFLPGGALEVGDGNEILDPARQLMDSGRFEHLAATQDWHPPGHVSFASSHEGRAPFDTMELHGHEQVLWPDHCVVGSSGAALSSDLPWQRVRAIIRKGQDPKVDSYSGFRNNWDAHGERPSTGLAGWIKDLGLTDVYVCGLARDYCVKWTAVDAADLGFSTHVIWDLTRPVDHSNDSAVRDEMQAHGIDLIETSAIYAD